MFTGCVAGTAVSNGQSEGHLSHAQKRRSPHTSPRGMLAGAAVGQGQAHTEPHDMPMPHWAPPGMSHAGSAPQVQFFFFILRSDNTAHARTHVWLHFVCCCVAVIVAFFLQHVCGF